MRYFVNIIADRRNLDLLPGITAGLSSRGIFPGFISSEAVDAHTARIRLDLGCEEKVMLGLRENWEFILRVQSVTTTPPLPEAGLTPAAHAPSTVSTD